MKNYFKVLGLAPTCRHSEVKEAYRQLALKYHPDRAGNSPLQHELFQQIQEAYEHLENIERFEAHARSMQTSASNYETERLSNTESLTLNVKALLNSWLSRRARQRLNIIELRMSVEEAIMGGFKNCQNQDKNYRVLVPAGTYNSQVLYDCYGPGQSPTVAVVKILPHPHLQSEERGVVLNLPISPAEAEIGARITLRTFTGNTSIVLSPRSQSGDEIKLQGRGPVDAHGRNLDLYLRLMIVTDEILISKRDNICDFVIKPQAHKRAVGNFS